MALALALVLQGLAAAGSPSVVVLDWQEGRFLVATPREVEGVDAASWNVTVDDCHRRLRADLLYDPANASVDVGSRGLWVPYTFRVNVTVGNWSVEEAVATSGYDRFLGETPHGGNGTLTLDLVRGANVTWELRLRGWEVTGERACAGS